MQTSNRSETARVRTQSALNVDAAIRAKLLSLARLAGHNGKEGGS